MSRQIKGFIFDMEGTIFSVEELHYASFAAAAQSYGIDITAEQILRLPGVVGAGDPGVINIILRHADVEYGYVDPEEFRLRKMKRYDELLQTATIAFRPGFFEFCRKVQEQGRPIAVASLTPRQQALPLIKRIGLDQLIDLSRFVLREDVANVKPAPDAFLEAVRRINVAPEETLIFDDGAKGIKAALAAGAIPIGMPYYWQPHIIGELMEARAEHIFRDWRTIDLQGLVTAVENE
jgi:beta-phosphoglucomutase